MADSQSSKETPNPTVNHLDISQSTAERSNLISPSKRLPGKQRPWVQWFFLDSWALECLAMVIAFAALLAIVVILIVYNGKLLDDWPYSIQLNTVLSTLATVFKGFLLMPVCASLCQLKWLWYTKKPKPLYDFQLFELASRGPWGAVQLLYHLKIWHMASVGSLVILFSLASDAFIQQTVSYPRRDSLSMESIPSVPYLQTFDQFRRAASTAPLTTQPLMAAIFNGVFASNLSLSTSAIRAQGCGSGNCSFPSYASLGVCSNCADVSNLFNYTFKPNTGLGVGESFVLPNGHSFSYSNTATIAVNITSDVSSEYSSSGPITALNSDKLDSYISPLAILNMTIIVESSVPNQMPFAYDCMLSFCARSYAASETLGIFQETTLDTFDQLKPLISISNVPWAWHFTVPSTHLVTIGDRNRTFSVVPTALTSLQEALRQQITGLTGTHSNAVFLSTTVVAQAFYFNGGERIVETVDNLATALTNAMRTSSTQTTATGEMLVEMTYISVQWWWLVLPLVIMVMGAVFLAATIWRTRKSDVPNWRSSALAIMEHGIDSWAKQSHHGSETGAPAIAAVVGKEKVSELETWADSMVVKLRRRGAWGRGYGLEPAEGVSPVLQE